MIKNQYYTGANNRQGLYDLFLTNSTSKKPLIVFVHGYMGYKDWGAWNLMAEEWLKAGFSSAKLNLTHNGTTIQQPTVFEDLEAFGNGGYWTELQDVFLFLDHLENEYNFNSFILVGHSRGGGNVLLAGKDERVKQIHCLAPICAIATRFPTGKTLEEWKITGVYYRENGRTKQQMPHYYKQYEDFLVHEDELNIEKACKEINKPVFVYHGKNDVSVLPSEGEVIAHWTNGKIYLIEDTAHTFDSVEPWNEDTLPFKMKIIVDKMIKNFKN